LIHEIAIVARHEVHLGLKMQGQKS
jgi:hypothetical protein